MNEWSHLKNWFQLPDKTKIRLFADTSRRMGLPSTSVIEKDWWIVHTLGVVYSLECSSSMIFKGGTSLSKGWQLINRFSEDIDLALNREFFGFTDELNKSDIRKLRKMSFEFISEVLSVQLNQKFAELGFENVSVKPEKVGNHNQDPLIIEVFYKKLTEIDPYLKPGVLLEIGSRSMNEPITKRTFRTYISELFGMHNFADEAITIPTVNPERTFLEKIFLLHEEFQKPYDKIRVKRLSRHLYDIERLSRTEFAKSALNDIELYSKIVKHREKFTPISGIDYTGHIPEKIIFIPPKEVMRKWEIDYNEMYESMIYGEKYSFSEMIERLLNLQSQINDIKIDN